MLEKNNQRQYAHMKHVVRNKTREKIIVITQIGTVNPITNELANGTIDQINYLQQTNPFSFVSRNHLFDERISFCLFDIEIVRNNKLHRTQSNDRRLFILLLL